MKLAIVARIEARRLQVAVRTSIFARFDSAAANKARPGLTSIEPPSERARRLKRLPAEDLRNARHDDRKTLPNTKFLSVKSETKHQDDPSFFI